MATAQQMVDKAASQIGYTESPSGSNHTKYGAWYGLDYNPWCDMFVSWCADQIGAGNVVGKYAYCPSHVNYFKNKGQWLDREEKPRPGDIVFFSNGSRACHVGIVERRNGTSSVTTIEGNTSVTSNDNGGAVMRRTRTYGKVGSSWYILGFGRPNYDGASGTVTSGNTSGSGSSSSSASKFKNGTYTITASELCVRTGPGTNYRVKKHSELTADGKKHDSDRDGALARGTRVTVSETRKVGKDVWGKIPSGWIALYYQGNTYATLGSSSGGGSSSSSSVGSYSNRTYTITASALNVRTGAGTKYAKKSKSQLTADGRKHANANGALLKGTRVTVSQTKVVGNDVWGKIPSGWICLEENGKSYVS